LRKRKKKKKMNGGLKCEGGAGHTILQGGACETDEMKKKKKRKMRIQKEKIELS